ncbi:hypothetical protein B7990_04205 [Fibrobacter sp. UWB4]|uniref:hypothetical protein n=1 Tax=Fibrobacter sp. UWB4 TaxID=1964356 RepID=UPI000B52108A|nr:hypothetical protein [Fibrobacter sp. UWB4]OWV20374.1 hypothetical protein B7990_04205 [Fibrobacter sp. UWB4]
MKTKFSRLTLSLVIAGVFALAATTFTGCSMLKKVQAAKILIQTKMEYKDLTFDSVDVYEDILDLVNNGMNGFLPNPKAVMLVKDLSQNIINKNLGNANFDVYLNANNAGKDTLWINKLQIEIKFDTLVTLPLTLKDTIKLAPGDNDLHFNAAFPLDAKIFKFKEVQYYGISGFIDVSLTEGGQPVTQDFEIRRDVKPEDVEKIQNLVRDRLFDLLVNKWLGSIIK